MFKYDINTDFRITTKGPHSIKFEKLDLDLGKYDVLINQNIMNPASSKTANNAKYCIKYRKKGKYEKKNKIIKKIQEQDEVMKESDEEQETEIPLKQQASKKELALAETITRKSKPVLKINHVSAIF